MARIFVGTSANGEDSAAELTLEYTLRKNSSCAPEIIWMRQTRDTSSIWGGWKTSDWHTPFSGFRWAIPEACDFKGRAIYMDVDMLNFRDIDDLFTIDMGDKPLMARTYNGTRASSVILFDCEKMKEHLPSISDMKTKFDNFTILNNKLMKLAGTFDARWNCMDGENCQIDDIWILHYTRMPSQPWKPKWFKGVTQPHHRPEIAKLWHTLHEEALAAGCKAPSDYEPFGQYDIIGQ